MRKPQRYTNGAETCRERLRAFSLVNPSTQERSKVRQSSGERVVFWWDVAYHHVTVILGCLKVDTCHLIRFFFSICLSKVRLMYCGTLALTSHHLTYQQPKMIRKQARQRRDYLYRKALILKEAETTEKRAQLRSALASGKPIDPEIAKNKALRKDYQYDESRPDRTVDEEMDLDDEYSQLSGISEPRLLVTVSLLCSPNPGT